MKNYNNQKLINCAHITLYLAIPMIVGVFFEQMTKFPPDVFRKNERVGREVRLSALRSL